MALLLCVAPVFLEFRRFGSAFFCGMDIAINESMKIEYKKGTLRVLLVDESFERAAILKNALHDAACEMVAHVSSTADLAGLVSVFRPDVIILDIESPDRDSLEHLCIVSRDQPRPIVMFTYDDDSDKIRAAIRAGVSAYVVDSIKSEKLRPIMDAAMASFNEFQNMRTELMRAESQLAERQDIDRAKAILMKQKGWAEDAAYQALRKMAMDKGMKIGEVARHFLVVSDLIG